MISELQRHVVALQHVKHLRVSPPTLLFVLETALPACEALMTVHDREGAKSAARVALVAVQHALATQQQFLRYPAAVP